MPSRLRSSSVSGAEREPCAWCAAQPVGVSSEGVVAKMVEVMCSVPGMRGLVSWWVGACVSWGFEVWKGGEGGGGGVEGWMGLLEGEGRGIPSSRTSVNRELANNILLLTGALSGTYVTATHFTPPPPPPSPPFPFESPPPSSLISTYSALSSFRCGASMDKSSVNVPCCEGMVSSGMRHSGLEEMLARRARDGAGFVVVGEMRVENAEISSDDAGGWGVVLVWGRGEGESGGRA